MMKSREKSRTRKSRKSLGLFIVPLYTIIPLRLSMRHGKEAAGTA
jgi:hypothetical protein